MSGSPKPTPPPRRRSCRRPGSPASDERARDPVVDAGRDDQLLAREQLAHFLHLVGCTAIGSASDMARETSGSVACGTTVNPEYYNVNTSCQRAAMLTCQWPPPADRAAPDRRGDCRGRATRRDRPGRPRARRPDPPGGRPLQQLGDQPDPHSGGAEDARQRGRRHLPPPARLLRHRAARQRDRRDLRRPRSARARGRAGSRFHGSPSEDLEDDGQTISATRPERSSRRTRSR